MVMWCGERQMNEILVVTVFNIPCLFFEFFIE